MRRPSGLLMIALAAASIGGCREAESKRAVAVVEGFVAALERGDGAAACDRLAEGGVSELLLAAVRARVDAAGLDAPDAERCAIIASRLADDAADRLARLRRSPVTGTLLEGERVVVRTEAGAYEAREVEGRWRVTRLEPVVTAVTGSPQRRPVHLTIVRPKLEEPALGRSLAGRTDNAAIEISGSLEPADASLRVVRSSGARVRRVESRGGRFRIVAALQHGPNKLLLRADAPARDPFEVAVELRRGVP